MEIIRGLENVTRVAGVALTVGSFDGLHLGHQRILKRMSTTGDPVTILTFNPHPQALLRPGVTPPPLLTSFEERIELFAKYGAERLIIAQFTREFAKMSAEEFVENILVNLIGMEHIFVGPTHGFGRNRKGDVNLLRELGTRLNFSVEVIEAVGRFSAVVSSSRIRKSLLAGDALTAWRCLGRPFYLLGTVIKGDARGKILGFPTANLHLEEPGKLIPPAGVYATIVEVDGVRWPSISHFGPRPTFKDAVPSVETHIIGFDADIYGKKLGLGVIDRMRDIITFASPADLVRQMQQDRILARKRLAELGFSADARMRLQRYGQIS